MDHLTPDQAAKHFNVSVGTLRRWAKQGKVNFTHTPGGHRRYSTEAMTPPPKPNDGRAMSDLLASLPPGGGTFVLPAIQQAAGVFSAGRFFYHNPSEALRDNRINARNMLRDPQVTEPLQARRLAVAELEWHVEPPDKKDREQEWIAQEIQATVEEIPDFLKFKNALLWATWFGKSGVLSRMEWCWRRGYKRLVIKDWIPVHGDSLYDKWDSDRVGILTGVSNSNQPGMKDVTTEPTDVARAHVLTGEDDGVQWLGDGLAGLPNERDALVVHRHELLAGDFFESQERGYVKGYGIRDALYWAWYLSSEIRGWLLEYLERVGSGLTIYRYLRGDQESYAAVKQIAESQSFQNVLLFPVDPSGGLKAGENIERMEPSPVAIENMLKVLDEYFGGQIKRFIVGQVLTSEAEPTGMGSKVSETHENTFNRLVRWDATCLEETLTRELVGVLMKHTFPNAGFECKFKINVDRPDPKEYLESAKIFYELGGSLDEDEVRGVLGFSKPEPDAAVLKRQEGQPGGGMTDLLSGGTGEEARQQDGVREVG